MVIFAVRKLALHPVYLLRKAPLARELPVQSLCIGGRWAVDFLARNGVDPIDARLEVCEYMWLVLSQGINLDLLDALVLLLPFLEARLITR